MAFHLLRRLVYLWRQRQMDADLQEELALHREMKEAELQRSGITSDDAKYASLRALGNATLAREDARAVWIWRWVDDLWRDVVYSIRRLRTAPAYSAVIIVTLALGVGANTAIFSVVYGVLVRPLPYRDADRLVVFDSERNFAGRPRPVQTNFSLVDLEQWQHLSQSLQSVALVASSRGALQAHGGGQAVGVATVTGDFFATIDGSVLLGRPLGSTDDQLPVVVISRRLWQLEFAGSPSVIGSQLTLDRQLYTIVGVGDSTFQLPDTRTDIWRTAGFARTLIPGLARPGAGGFLPIGRLKPGATAEQASIDGETVVRALTTLDPKYDGIRVRALGLGEQLVATVKPAILVLFVTVGLVLFVSCANVANLLLARHASRAREQAIRRALGASRGRLARQELVFTGVLATCGAMFGIALASVTMVVLNRVRPIGLPRLDAIHLDGPVLLYTIGITAVTMLAVGLLSALRWSDAPMTLRVGMSDSGGRRWQRVRQTLIVAELSVAAMLLVGASLLGRSLVRLMTIDIGVSAEHVTAAQVEMFRGQGSSFIQRQALMDRMIERVRGIPGVTAAGAGVALPPNRAMLRFTINRLDEAIGQPTDYLVDVVTATPEYFTALGIRLRNGRLFSRADDAAHPPVMILSAVSARQMFGATDPVGRTVTLPILTSNPNVPADHAPVTIVGIVDDVKYSGLEVPADGVIYRPFAQQPYTVMFIAVRTPTDITGLEQTLRRAIVDVEPSIVIHSVNTVEGLISDAVAQPRLRAVVLFALAGLTVALAAVGLYGVMAYLVAQRTAEIGIRMALGADSRDVLHMVLREGMTLGIAGVVMGLLGALAFTKLFQTLLFGIEPTDTASFVGASGVLLVVTFWASYFPARRATRMNPLTALRCE